MKSSPSLKDLSKMIDHSLLHPTMTDAEIIQGCEIAVEYDVATACVKPYSIDICQSVLKGSDVAICSVIGFPHGNHTTQIKAAETELAIQNGALEIDMVVNIGKALGGDWEYVTSEINAVQQKCTGQGVILKVIFETDYLMDQQIIKLCQICSEVQVGFVKTSSGYGFVKQPDGNYNYMGATDHVLSLMRKHTAEHIQIKAAGGVRTLDDLLRVRALGVTRIGATATKTILEEAKKRGIQ